MSEKIADDLTLGTILEDCSLINVQNSHPRCASCLQESKNRTEKLYFGYISKY